MEGPRLELSREENLARVWENLAEWADADPLRWEVEMRNIIVFTLAKEAETDE